jgi:hypothetical protein
VRGGADEGGTLAITILLESLGSWNTLSPSLEYSGVRRLQWPHLRTVDQT